MGPLRIFSLLLLLLLTLGHVKAQDQAGDREQLLKQVNALQTTATDSAVLLLESAIPEFSNLDQALLIKKLGELYRRSGRLPETDSLYHFIEPTLQQSAQHLELLQVWQAHIGISFQQGKLEQGIGISVEALNYIEKNEGQLTGRSIELAVGDVFKNTGILYAIQADSKPDLNDRVADVNTAKSYFRRGLNLYSEYDAKELQATALFNLGTVSLEIDSTIHYYALAGEIYDQLNLPFRKADISLNLGILHIDRKEYATALDYLKDADAKMRRPDPYNETLLLVKLGRVNLRLGNLKNTVEYIREAIPLCEQYELRNLELEAYEILLPALYGQNNTKAALEAYIKYDTLSKRARFNEAEQITRDIEAQYKTKEQADAIQILEQSEALNKAKLARQRLIIIMVIAGLLLIGLVSYFLWKRGKERQELNEKLRKLDQARTRFLVNISHELRTPLTLVHAPLQDAIEQLEQGKLARVEKDLSKIRNNTNKLLQLTEEVLDISKLDEGALSLELVPTNLKKFINLVFFSFESLAIRQGLKWQCDVNLPNQNFEIDQRKLEKVLNNLLSNAIKNTPKGGSVSLEANAKEGQLHISIKDTGKGIPANKLERIFQRYYQAGKEQQESGGLGIGLAFVKELLDFMQGSISVESSLDKGTTFTFRLPTTETSEKDQLETSFEESEISLENRPSIHLGNSEKPHVLVVEDHPEMSDFIQQLLSDQYRVTLADHGKEGIERLHSGSFDLVTADVMMPEMDGISFVKAIKSHADWKNLPVVMITALSEEADKIEGLQLGIDDYIPKPFNANELKVRIANLLSNARVRQEMVATPDSEPLGNEEKLLVSARELVEARLDQNEFGVKDLADHLNLSERQANRVLKKMTGLSCLQFIREIKMQKAYRYLEVRQFATIAEVAYAVGFENTSYFTRLFTERFGKKPSDFFS